MQCLIRGDITPIYNDEILAEYYSVLTRPKFNLPDSLIDETMEVIKEFGINSSRQVAKEQLPDPKDIVFTKLLLLMKIYSLLLAIQNIFQRSHLWLLQLRCFRLSKRWNRLITSYFQSLLCAMVRSRMIHTTLISLLHLVLTFSDRILHWLRHPEICHLTQLAKSLDISFSPLQSRSRRIAPCCSRH